MGSRCGGGLPDGYARVLPILEGAVMTSASELRRWRGENNLSQDGLARRLCTRGDEMGIHLASSGQLVGKWERGEIRWPSPDYRRVLEDVTGLSCESLGFEPPWNGDRVPQEGGSRVLAPSPTGAPNVAEDHDEEEDPVQRRTWLAGVAGLTLSRASAALMPSASTPIPPTVAAADVGVIRDMLAALTASDRQFGGGHARGYATDYLWNVVRPRLSAHADEMVLRDMFTASTEFALRVASMHLDAGHARTSRTLLATASSLAQESDDLTLSAWVLARQGEQEIHEKNVDRAVAYTGGAVALARQAPPATRAFIVTKHALALSMTGDRPATLRVLGKVRDAYDKAGGPAEPAWMSLYGWGHLRHEEGRCYYNLGMGREAVQAAEESMQVQSRDRFARPRAFSLGVQAIGYAQAKEIEKACIASQELVAVAGQLASERVRIRLAEVLQALREYRNLAAVRDLHEAARPVLAGTPQ
jgi:transcriptional regulator with XRE-family HTH domain